MKQARQVQARFLANICFRTLLPPQKRCKKFSACRLAGTTRWLFGMCSDKVKQAPACLKSGILGYRARAGLEYSEHLGSRWT